MAPQRRNVFLHRLSDKLAASILRRDIIQQPQQGFWQGDVDALVRDRCAHLASPSFTFYTPYYAQDRCVSQWRIEFRHWCLRRSLYHEQQEINASARIIE
jgi:hypothetical protein